MGGLARQLVNDDTTDIGYDLFLDQITSPAAGDVGVTRICVGSSTTYTPMSSSNPLFAQLTAGTAEIGTVTANLSATDNAVLDAIAASVAGTLTVGSHAVTNAGTFAVQATLAAETTKVIGTINVSAGQTIAVTNAGTFATQATLQASTAEIGKLAAGVAEIGNVKNSGTFAVQAAQSGTWNVTNISGTVSLPTGASTAAKQPALGTAGTASTDVITVQGIASMTAFLVDGSAVTQPVSNAALSVTGGGVESGALRVTIASDSTGVLSVDDNGGSLTMDLPAVATGGATPGKLISAATTNATSIKASAGTLYSLCCFNTNAAARYLKFYNKASAPTVGTDTSVQVFTIPGNTAGAGLVVPIPACGMAFSTGIAFATTTGAADTDTGAVAANEIVVSYSYK